MLVTTNNECMVKKILKKILAPLVLEMVREELKKTAYQEVQLALEKALRETHEACSSSQAALDGKRPSVQDLVPDKGL